MKQIDILRHAKDYLDQLNHRVDPVSGAYLPETSAAREEPVRRLLFFASKNLERIIAYDDAALRPPFTITPDQQKKLIPASGPVTSMELITQINRRIDQGMYRGLGRTTLLNWLVEQGYLKNTGPKKRQPTSRGYALGINVQTGQMLFEPAAQRFIIDHLDAIARYGQASASPKGQQKSRVLVKHPEKVMENIQAMGLLAQGYHPITQAPLAFGDPLNQEQLRECFDYAAGAFIRTLEAGYFTAKQPFTLPQELWDKIPVTEELAVPLSVFVGGVNELLCDPTAVQPLSKTSVLKYLLSQGFLMESLTKTGRKTYCLTPEGSTLGINHELTVMDETSQKCYPTWGVNANAQRYLVEHMGELIACAAQQE